MSTATVEQRPKIYHLIDNGKSSIEQYKRVSATQRVRIDNRRNDRPYLQVTFTDKEGNNKTIRFKLNCNTIDQQEQIDKFKILANVKFSDAEMDMLRFHNGVVIVKNKIGQLFLDSHPQNETFDGECPEITQRLFREYNPQVKVKNELNDIRRRAKAMDKILALDMESAQATLIRLNGSFYNPKTALGLTGDAESDHDLCITALIDFVDASDDTVVEDILRDGQTLAEEITILVGRSIQEGLISFDEPGMDNFVVKKKGGQVIPLKEISSNNLPSERIRFFEEFLASSDGTLHLNDIRNELKALKPKSETVPQEPAGTKGAAKEEKQKSKVTA